MVSIRHLADQTWRVRGSSSSWSPRCSPSAPAICRPARGGARRSRCSSTSSIQTSRLTRASASRSSRRGRVDCGEHRVVRSRCGTGFKAPAESMLDPVLRRNTIATPLREQHVSLVCLPCRASKWIAAERERAANARAFCRVRMWTVSRSPLRCRHYAVMVPTL
jgi:hypothetical protein